MIGSLLTFPSLGAISRYAAAPIYESVCADLGMRPLPTERDIAQRAMLATSPFSRISLTSSVTVT